MWATSLQEGLLWRIDPGRPPVTRTIDVGVGVSFVSHGEGAVWTGNYIDGTVSRIHPSRNAVTKKSAVGTPQALAAGAGAAWVSVAGGTEEGALSTAACTPVASRVEDPDVLIASDFPLQGPDSAGPRALADAIRFVLEDHEYRAGEHTVGYQSCDDSTRETGSFELRKCAANASAYGRAKRLVAVIGTYNSNCAQMEIPVLNRAPGGPVAMISPSNTYPGLTVRRSVLPAPDGYRGEPAAYYPTGERNYARVVARDDLPSAALAMLAKQLRLKGVYVLDDAHPVGRIIYAQSFRRAARRLGSRSQDPPPTTTPTRTSPRSPRRWPGRARMACCSAARCSTAATAWSRRCGRAWVAG